MSVATIPDYCNHYSQNYFLRQRDLAARGKTNPVKRLSVIRHQPARRVRFSPPFSSLKPPLFFLHPSPTCAIMLIELRA